MKAILKVSVGGILIVVIALTIAGLNADLSPKPAANTQGDFLQIGDITIRYTQQGRGQDVVLIHGLPGSIEDWESITNRLAKHYRVTVYDRPGHGYSEYKPELANLEGNTDIAFALLAELKLDKPIVVGHSYGGAIAASMASRTPENIGGFVSIGGIIVKDHTDGIFQLLNIPGLGPGIALIANQSIGLKMMEEGVPRAFYPNNDVIPENYIESRAPMWLTVKNSLAATGEEVTMPTDLNAVDLASIQHPFSILQGDKDLSVPLINAEKLHANIKGSSLQVLRETGHFIQYAHPEEVVKAIDQMALTLSNQ